MTEKAGPDRVKQMDVVAERRWSTSKFLKLIGIRPLAPVQNSVSLMLMQRKTLNFVINLPDVENITKLLDSILTKISIIKRFYTLEFMLSLHRKSAVF